MGQAVVYCDVCGSRVTEKQLKKGKATSFRKRTFCEDCKEELSDQLSDGDSAESSKGTDAGHDSSSLQDLVASDEDKEDDEQQDEELSEVVEEVQNQVRTTRESPVSLSFLSSKRFVIGGLVFLVMVFGGGGIAYSYYWQHLQQKQIRTEVSSLLSEVDDMLASRSRKFTRMRKKIRKAEKRAEKLSKQSHYHERVKKRRSRYRRRKQQWNNRKQKIEEQMQTFEEQIMGRSELDELLQQHRNIESYWSSIEEKSLKKQYRESFERIAREGTKNWIHHCFPDGLPDGERSELKSLISTYYSRKEQCEECLTAIEKLANQRFLSDSFLMSLKEEGNDQRTSLKEQLLNQVRTQFRSLQDQVQQVNQRSEARSLTSTIYQTVRALDESVPRELHTKYRTLGTAALRKWFHILETERKQDELNLSLRERLRTYDRMFSYGQRFSGQEELLSSIRSVARKQLQSRVESEIGQLTEMSQEFSLEADLKSYTNLRTNVNNVRSKLKALLREASTLIANSESFYQVIEKKEQRMDNRLEEIVMAKRNQFEQDIKERIQEALDEVYINQLDELRSEIRDFQQQFYRLPSGHFVRKQNKKMAQKLKDRIDQARGTLNSRLEKRKTVLFSKGKGRKNFQEVNNREIAFRLESEDYVLENTRMLDKESIFPKKYEGGVWVGEDHWRDYRVRISYEVTSGPGFIVALRASGNLNAGWGGVQFPFVHERGNGGIMLDREGTVELKVQQQFAYYRTNSGRSWSKLSHVEDGKQVYKIKPEKGKIMLIPLPETTLRISRFTVTPLDE